MSEYINRQVAIPPTDPGTVTPCATSPAPSSTRRSRKSLKTTPEQRAEWKRLAEQPFTGVDPFRSFVLQLIADVDSVEVDARRYRAIRPSSGVMMEIYHRGTADTFDQWADECAANADDSEGASLFVGPDMMDTFNKVNLARLTTLERFSRQFIDADTEKLVIGFLSGGYCTLSAIADDFMRRNPAWTETLGLSNEARAAIVKQEDTDAQ